ncbi:MAG: hypothetical protein UIH99_03345 [Alphaproteobacteria bacterium]|nr:hypothetical protein [Alphaproteobacteria bacterium]
MKVKNLFVVFSMFVMFCVAATAAEVSSVKYVDDNFNRTTDAANLLTGTVDINRLPVGTSSTTVASGSDNRFDTVSVGQPSTTAPSGRTLIWVEQ